MRWIILSLIAASLGAAEMRQLGPTEDLPYCRVVLERDGKQVAHDGWYCAATRHLFPLNANQDLFYNGPIPEDFQIVSAASASRQPGRMPAICRCRVNDFIAKNHPQVPDTDPMPAAASPAHVAAKP